MIFYLFIAFGQNLQYPLRQQIHSRIKVYIKHTAVILE